MTSICEFHILLNKYLRFFPGAMVFIQPLRRISDKRKLHGARIGRTFLNTGAAFQASILIRLNPIAYRNGPRGTNIGTRSAGNAQRLRGFRRTRQGMKRMRDRRTGCRRTPSRANERSGTAGRDLFDELFHFSPIFLTRGGFRPAADVHRKGMQRVDGGTDVFGAEPAR